MAAETGHLASAIVALPSALQCVISFATELIVSDLRADNGQPLAWRKSAEEAVLRPERWLDALRREARGKTTASRMQAARLLDEVGRPADVALLRAIAREAQSSRR